MIIKLEPVFFDKIWGGTKLKSNYNFNVSDTCGECWGISAHKSASSKVLHKEYSGLTLRDLYNRHRALFGNYDKEEFPILVKVIDASKNLSIQVHPDDTYAATFNSLGKEECWYILDAEENTNIIIGHNAKTTKEFKNAITTGTLETLCNQFPIKKKDFFYIEAGTLHAICKGTTLLEVQQSSDITYRVYDYNRLQDGAPRDLHVKEALDVVDIPAKELITTHKDTYFNYDIITNQTLTRQTASKHGDYIFIIEGEGSFDKTPVRKGEFIMVPSLNDYTIFGNVTYQKTTF
jgi:mannose-6-phosphate isomerase class I